MQEDRLTWLLRKGMLALPVILVLALARCGGDTAGSGEETTTEESSEPNASQQATEPEPEPEPEKQDTQAQTGDSTKKRDPEEFTAGEIKAAMREHIENRTQMGNPGVFEITDPRTSQTLELRFQKIHDPVRTMGDGHYFACTNFAAIGDPYKTYDLDFWLQVHDGELVVYEENVHKLPVHEHGEWVQQPRYNFVNDRINLLR
ncbi:hypothetical protein DES49_1338 [Halospina denitrificans]|uniref:Uncharacterized protein n=1 Tax=Halospina denitrificans TaxID=332522 RepID=A0A4R7JYD6_9GAMM|nr:hypothetical protein [Halospina denitrificans]TDT43520.1 hypothetical protein DES49_1338 [Halospina denitrificans]